MVVVLPAILVWGAVAGAQGTAAPEVTSVGVSGLERVSEQAVRSQIEVQQGQAYNPNAVARDIRRLYGLGHFETIEANAEQQVGGVALTYVFTEKRIIDDIKILGNRKIRTPKIRGVISWRQGDSFSPDMYDEERAAILKLYEEKGFANTSVDINVEEIGPSRVRITYVIDEGRKARIAEITFTGNDALPDRKLRKAMKTKRAWLFLGGKYDETKFEADLQKLVDEYGDVGHLEAAVTGTTVEYTPNGKKMLIDVAIAEGSQYRVGALDIADNTVFDDDELLSAYKVQAGDVHSKSQVSEDILMAERGYKSSGYVNAAVTPQVTLDRDAKTTHVTQKVNEGDLKYVREVDITGNKVTKDEVVRRELMLNPGDRFDGSALEFSQRRLENTQYFDNVRLTLRDDEENDLYTNLMADVEEGKTGNFNFGAGYSTEEKLGGFAELRLNNFDISNWPSFSGGGQVFSTKLQVGSVRNSYSVSFTEPEIFGYPLSFGIDAYNESYRYTENSNYTEEMAGGQLRFGKSMSPYVTVNAAFAYTDYDYSDLALRFLYTPEWRQELEGSSTARTVWAIERNTLDFRRDPSAGGKHVLSLSVAGFGADNEFVKIEHDSTWYKALGAEKKWVVSFRTRHGWASEYGSSDFVPVSDRFFAGGTSTVRGYKNRDIGPEKRLYWLPWSDKEPYGGDLRLVNNLELKYKLTDMFRLYTFVDSGGVWEDASDFDFGDIKYSAGVGFGVDVPKMGPIRVDYGVPLNPEDDQGNGRLHLLTGFRF